MTARKLRISTQLALPLDFITSTDVVYGGKGMGKTNLGSVLVEECAAAGLRFAVLDPMGVWWGLRHSADGKGPGIEVLILGGIHGDIPIEPTGGAVVADLVVDEDANVIIDISRRPDGSMWSIGERVRFVRDYCKRLYQRQGERRRPIKQLIDEAARFIPQIVRKDEGDVAACMGAIAVLVEEGRNVGVGVCLITQRSARLNKDVAELADCMIAFRTVGPNSRRAVLDWLGEHVEKSRLRDLDEKVRALPRGSALVVSPGWLEYEGIVPVRMRTTFDSSATPKAGQERRASGPGAKPDLAKYQARMAATIEKAKAEDPRELRKRITELERQLAGAGRGASPPRAVEKVKTVVEKVEVPVLKDAQVGALDRIVTRLEKLAPAQRELIDGLRTVAAEIRQAIAPRPGTFGAVRPQVVTEPRRTRTETETARPVQTSAPRAPRQDQTADRSGLPRPQQRILDALAWLESVGIPAPHKTQLAVLADQSPTSSTYTNHLGELRTAGLIDYPGPGRAHLTAAGRERAEILDRPATSEDLQRALYARLPKPQARILEELVAIYPESLAKEELATRVQQSAISSTYTNHLGALRSLGFIDYPQPGRAVALPVLFLEGARQ